MLFLQLNQKKNYEKPNSSQCSGPTFGTKIWYWWLMATKNLGYSWPRRPSSRSTAQFCIAELELKLFPYENPRCNSDFGKNSSRKQKKLVELELNCTFNLKKKKCNYEKQVEEKKTYLEVEHFFNWLQHSWTSFDLFLLHKTMQKEVILYVSLLISNISLQVCFKP
jgi:hypothetical protein